jgi:hypothetical protein
LKRLFTFCFGFVLFLSVKKLSRSPAFWASGEWKDLDGSGTRHWGQVSYNLHKNIRRGLVTVGSVR